MSRDARPSPPEIVVGRPVDNDRDFVGRDLETKRILRSIERARAVQLVGPERMGKTSLLLWVKRHAPAERPVVWVDVGERFTPSTLVRAIAAALGRPDVTAGWDDAVPGHAAAGALRELPPFVLLLDDAHKLARDGRGFDQDFFAKVRLIQRAGEELCKRLNERRELRATAEDVEAAFDVLLGGKADRGDVGLQELWDQRTEEERACLLRMVEGESPAPRDPAARSLLLEEFIEERDGKLQIAVPLFRDWIKKNG